MDETTTNERPRLLRVVKGNTGTAFLYTYGPEPLGAELDGVAEPVGNAFWILELPAAHPGELTCYLCLTWLNLDHEVYERVRAVYQAGPDSYLVQVQQIVSLIDPYNLGDFDIYDPSVFQIGSPASRADHHMHIWAKGLLESAVGHEWEDAATLEWLRRTAREAEEAAAAGTPPDFGGVAPEPHPQLFDMRLN